MLPRTFARIIFLETRASYFELWTWFFLRKVACDFDQTLKFKAQSTKINSSAADVAIRINYADNRAIGRCVFTLKRKARFFPTAPENQFAHAGARCINGNQRLSLWGQIFVEGLHDEQLTIPKRFVLDCGHYCADYARELHFISRE